MSRKIKGNLPSLTTNRHRDSKQVYVFGGRRITYPSKERIQIGIYKKQRIMFTSRTVRYRPGTAQKKRRRDFRRRA